MLIFRSGYLALHTVYNLRRVIRACIIQHRNSKSPAPSGSPDYLAFFPTCLHGYRLIQIPQAENNRPSGSTSFHNYILFSSEYFAAMILSIPSANLTLGAQSSSSKQTLYARMNAHHSRFWIRNCTI